MPVEISASALLTGCEILRGAGASRKNTAAIVQVYNSIKTSYGPLGLDKMCIDASGAVSVTNDGATILSNMLIEDPAAKLLVNLALEQDKEVGDGTTSVVLFAANLITKGSQLIDDGVHPSVVVSGYRMAFNESVKYIKGKMARRLSAEDAAIDAVTATSISSKIINQEKEHFLQIVKQALTNVNENGKYRVEKINILKSVGGSLRESIFLNGYVLNCSVASKLMPTRIERPQIACLGFSLLREKLPLSVNIQVTDPEKLEEIRIKEIEMTKNKCRAIIDSGANLILMTGGIDEMCIKMFIDHGIAAVRRCERDDLVALAKAIGTDLKDSIVDVDNEYRLLGLGTCGAFEIKPLGDYDLVYLDGCPENLSTILIRGPNTQIVDEAQRALNDALQILKRTLESKSIVPGGGAVEAALSFLLEEFAAEVNCKEHVAIHRYAEALLELPRILAANAGLPASRLVAELLKQQRELYTAGEYSTFLGLDVLSGAVQDNLAGGIVEPTIYKLKILKAATEAAIGILRINEIGTFPSK